VTASKTFGFETLTYEIQKRFLNQVRIENITLEEAMNVAVKEWCENRAYLRCGREERRRLMWQVGQKSEDNTDGETVNSG
jgi:hypothetical protein